MSGKKTTRAHRPRTPSPASQTQLSAPGKGASVGEAAETPSFPQIYPKIFDLPGPEAIKFIWNIHVALNAEAKGIAYEDITEELAEAIRVMTLTTDSGDINSFAIEKVLHAIARGDNDRAAKLYDDLKETRKMEHAAFDEAQTGRRKQRKAARQPRPSSLTAIIEEILAIKPDASWRAVLSEIAGREGDGVVDSVEDGKIWVREQPGAAPKGHSISGLKDRISRVRKNLRSP